MISLMNFSVKAAAAITEETETAAHQKERIIPQTEEYTIIKGQILFCHN